ncbi:hypothetical protein MLD38_037620 [Melastoma candidum]|uniref:Uncharacterized protein n=1 Tax=Melastoma candidum TaxID=119954 RepID=A0ACB9LQ05_9MYRT|nr:hypothetical protein MLD38_037620 [Melastoma candidum]
MSHSEHLKSPNVYYDESVFVGREYDADRLTAYLTDSDFLRVISIVGDEGIGKTALRSRQSLVMTLKDLELKETDKLWAFLHKTLMELRYLIVLDDLKSDEILDNLLYALPDSRNGSRVIITCREVVHLPLHEEPWGYSSPGGQLDPENSPFKNRDLDSSPMAWLCNLEEDWWRQDVRSLSYNSLPSWVKPCFLYLCSFPKEYEISTRRMFLLWHAESLVRWDGHFTAEAYFQELANRNLVQVVRLREMDGGPKTCRVSGYLHDHFSEFASSGIFVTFRMLTRRFYGRVIQPAYCPGLLDIPATTRASLP